MIGRGMMWERIRLRPSVIHVLTGLTCPSSHRFTGKSESLQIYMQYDVETSYFQCSNMFCVYLLLYLLDFVDFWIFNLALIKNINKICRLICSVHFQQLFT